MEKLSNIIFYTLEKSIKTYRQFAQRNISAAGFTITIDQWLVLKTIQEDSSISQQQLALKVFKDFASITRIIELLVKNGYLIRNFHKEDRRRFELTLSKEGVTIIKSLEPVINKNRTKALYGLSVEDIENLQTSLNKIISNLNNK
ncbi:MAG: MarR family transcriptional regulator [Bacteroidetes Order II. Incertae sedis bacterium]|nr:MarR family transcriptional regulator [Bacteroidetes Order II. bacterium]